MDHLKTSGVIFNFELYLNYATHHSIIYINSATSSSHYLNIIYILSIHYLHTIYTLSTHYLQNICVQPTRTSGCSGPSSLGPHGRCSSHSSTTRPRPSPSQPSRRGRTAHSSRVSNTKFAFSKWESGLDNENCLNANEYFYSDFP